MKFKIKSRLQRLADAHRKKLLAYQQGLNRSEKCEYVYQDGTFCAIGAILDQSEIDAMISQEKMGWHVMDVANHFWKYMKGEHYGCLVDLQDRHDEIFRRISSQTQQERIKAFEQCMFDAFKKYGVSYAN